jgi:hypothetical protein
MGLSIRGYARHRGVSHTAVQKAIASGRITPEPDGTIEPARADAEWSANTNATQGQRKRASGGSRKGRVKPVPEAAVSAVRETLRESGEPVTAGGTTFMQARTANEVLKAQTARIRLQRLKGELVDRARAAAHVFRLARNERDAWLNWPARVAALMAAELGVDQHEMHVVLEKHVRSHLTELAEVRPRLD